MLLYRLLKYNVLLYYRFTHNCTNVWQHCLERTASVAGKNLCFLPGPARQLLPSYAYSVSYFHKKSTILGSYVCRLLRLKISMILPWNHFHENFREISWFHGKLHFFSNFRPQCVLRQVSCSQWLKFVAEFCAMNFIFL